MASTAWSPLSPPVSPGLTWSPPVSPGLTWSPPASPACSPNPPPLSAPGSPVSTYCLASSPASSGLSHGLVSPPCLSRSPQPPPPSPCLGSPVLPLFDLSPLTPLACSPPASSGLYCLFFTKSPLVPPAWSQAHFRRPVLPRPS